MTTSTQQRNVNLRRARANATRRFRNRRKRLAVKLLGGCCSNCGVEGNLLFCAKHVGERSILSQRALTATEKRFLAEVDRTVLLCDACYWERLMSSPKRRKFTHGTYYAYYKRKCRCDLCLEARKRKKQYDYDQRKKTRAGSSTG